MGLTRKHAKPILYGLTALAAILVASFVGRSVTGSAQTHATLSGNMLLTNNRSDLAICVEVEDTMEIAAREIRERVHRTLVDQVRYHSRWRELGYDQFPIRVEIGCPAPAYLLQPGALHPLLSGILAETPVPTVDVPSPYRVHLYVVSQAQIERIFYGTHHRVAPQEMLCEDRECFEVTSALYLSPGEVLNTETLQDGLKRVLALSLAEVLP